MLAAGLIFGASSVALSGKAEARTCLSYDFVSNKGRHTKRDKAKRNARVKWRAEVLLRHGPKYNSWELAADRRYDCTEALGVDICRAIARPCKN